MLGMWAPVLQLDTVFAETPASSADGSEGSSAATPQGSRPAFR